MLTNKRSGQQITQPQYFAAECVRANEDRTDGAFFANFYISGQSLYEPGDYTAEFVRSDGQRATFDQTIQIQRGSISIYFPSEESISLAENAIAPRFYASNLFPTDKPELLMNTRGQSPFVVKPATFLTMPLGFELPVLGNLQPGYYYAHLLLDSKPVNSFVRIAVARSFSDLVIQNLSDPVAQSSYSLLDPSQSFDTPVVLKHDKFYTLETNAYTSYLYKVKPGEVAVSRVRLTSLTDPSSFYLTSLLNDTSLSGNLLFPSTIPLGLYQLKFEILTPDKTILSSQPLERDVIIE